jgi:cold shock CspA family protein
VVVRGRSGRHQQGELFDVRIHIVMPSHEDVVVDRNPPADHAHEDPYVAIRDAFNAARRRLQDHERRAAGQVKSKEPTPHGWIDRISREDGFGFIRTSDGRELYFHRNALLHGDFDRVEPGAGVSFTEEEGEKGPQASTVHLLGRSRHIVAPV